MHVVHFQRPILLQPMDYSCMWILLLPLFMLSMAMHCVTIHIVCLYYLCPCTCMCAYLVSWVHPPVNIMQLICYTDPIADKSPLWTWVYVPTCSSWALILSLFFVAAWGCEICSEESHSVLTCIILFKNAPILLSVPCTQRDTVDIRKISLYLCIILHRSKVSLRLSRILIR